MPVWSEFVDVIYATSGVDGAGLKHGPRHRGRLLATRVLLLP